MAKMDRNKIKKRKRSRSSSKRKRKTERISSNSNISTHREKKSIHKNEKKKLPKIIPTNVGNIVGANSHTQVLEEPEEAYWEIEAIVDKRIMKKRVEYLVRWKGCPEDQNTWEPLDNLCDSAYREALRFSKDQKFKEQRRLDDEIRLGLFEGDSISNTLKNTIAILDEPSESEEEENFEMDAQIEIGEEEDDAWKWNDMEQLQFKPLERIDVNASTAREKVIEYRLNGTPFVLVNHVGWANFASRWLKKRDLSKDTGKDCNIIKLDKSSFPHSKTLEADSSSQSQLLQPLPTPPEKLDLSDPSLTLDVPTMLEDMGNEDVTVVRRNYNELSPIHGVIPVSKFLKVCWSKADKKEEVNGGTPLSSRIYLHQWQFPLSDTAGRKLGHQNVPLDSVLGEDLLCHWLDLPQCAGDNPLQYLFMGREDTHSKLHCDNGGLAITIAPIVGKKKCTLVHRLDGMSCLYHLNASLSKPDLNEYPLMANARIWQSVIEPGEILFMPAGTYHQCHNVTPCLSYSRFHLDDVNLVPFLRSFYDGDAKEIMHDEILWNACIGLMRKVEKIADDAGSGKGRKVTPLEFQTVTTLRKLRNIIKDVTRKSVIKDLIKGENTEGTVSESHDWFKLVNDVDLCLHEFRYRKYGTDAPRFKPLSTSVLTNSQKNLVGSVNVSKANETVIAYDTELENSYMQLKFAPKKWEELCLSTINVDDLLDVKLCKKVVKARVLEILKNMKAAHLTYEDYPSIYDEWQYFDNLRSVKGDGADLKESDIKEGTVVLNRWGDMKSEYRGKVTKTINDTLLRVRYLGLGSEVVERLVTVDDVIRKVPSTGPSISGEKKLQQETIELMEISDASTLSNSGANDGPAMEDKKIELLTDPINESNQLDEKTSGFQERSDISSLTNENNQTQMKNKLVSPEASSEEVVIQFREAPAISSLSNSANPPEGEKEAISVEAAISDVGKIGNVEIHVPKSSVVSSLSNISHNKAEYIEDATSKSQKVTQAELHLDIRT